MASWSEIFGDIYNNGKNSSRPVEIFIGQIKEIQPTKIKISNDILLEGGELHYSGSVAYLRNTKDESRVGKSVVGIKASGGQDFYIMDFLEDAADENGIAEIKSVEPFSMEMSDGSIIGEDMIIFAKGIEEIKKDVTKIGKKVIVTRSKLQDEYYIFDEKGD